MPFFKGMDPITASVVCQFQWILLIRTPYTPIDFLLKIKITQKLTTFPILQTFLWKDFIIRKWGNQVNANKILHLSAIYIQDMKITKSLCKKLLMNNDQRCRKFLTPSISNSFHGNTLYKDIPCICSSLYRDDENVVYYYVTSQNRRSCDSINSKTMV